MYKDFFGLSESPFNANPDPRFLYLTSQTQEALDELTYGIQNRKGFILLTGEVGTGKTTLINYLLDWLRQRKMPVAFIFNSHMSVNHLFEFIFTDFGISEDFHSKRNMLLRLNTWLVERFCAGENPVLIIDEAQGLSVELLEEIRLLLNLETASEKLLQIVLAGQPELEDKLKRPELRQLRQRITLRSRTAPLTLEESHGYITERLRIGGAQGGPIFASDAMDAVHFYSQGIPRIINLLCEHALINAYVEHLHLVPARIVEEAAHEFVLDEDRRFEPRRNSAAVVGSNPPVMHSMLVDDLASLFATEQAHFSASSHATSRAGLGTFVAIEEPALPARDNTATAGRHREAISASREHSNVSVFVKDLTPASVGREVKPEESALCLDSVAVPSSATPRNPEEERIQAPSLAIPPLPMTRRRTENESSSTAKSSSISITPNRALTRNTLNQLPRGSQRTAIHGLFPWRWRNFHWMNGFLNSISFAERSHVSFAALRRMLGRWKFEFRLDCIAMMNAIALPEMKKSLLRWLR
jgi:general secretion pathway protein A